MYLRHQAYTLYYRHVCILVFLHVFAYSMLLRYMLKFKRLACGSDDVAQDNSMFKIHLSFSLKHPNFYKYALYSLLSLKYHYLTPYYAMSIQP